MEFIKHGVPQGSILGPLFFLLYINDIASCSSILTFYLFADDTTIFLSHKDINTLERTLNEELVHVSNWLIANKLSLNVGKSNLLIFRHKNNNSIPALNIKINGLAVDEKDHAKYLGILIDNKLTFIHHIQHVNSKLTKGNAILSMVRHYLPKQILISTYNAYIQPHIDYGLNVWGYTNKSHLDIIARQQRKALRLMNFKRKRDDATDLFKTDKVLPLDENLKLSSAKLAWKANKGLLPSPVNSLFHPRSHNNSLHLPYRRLDITQRCSTYQGVKDWNQIPEQIRASNSLNILKTHYKNLLLSQINT